MDSDSSADVARLLKEAIENHRQGELTDAETGYLKVLELEPEHADALHLLGLVAYTLGNAKLGMERIHQSLAINPKQPIALTNLGNMLAETERLEEAIESYERAIELDPNYADAYHNLGNVLGDSDRVLEAIVSYSRALELRPDNVGTRMAIGITFEEIGRFEEAAEAFRDVIAVQPESIAARSRLGDVLRKMNRLSEARDVYDELLELSPQDPVVQHFRAVCEPESTPQRASEEYVKRTFDSSANEFDERLAKLNYRVPEQCAAMLDKHLGQASTADGSICDLGCGTGLCAPFLRKRAERLVGVDLSPGMLEKARQRELYDELIEADLVSHLSAGVADYDLLVAADTLIYIGDLQPTFAAAAAALRDGGHLLFSVEKLADNAFEPGYQLAWSGRYRHSEEVLRRWLVEAGFEVLEVTETELRRDGDDSIFGYLVMAIKR
jgi:predicted TPR repeat methyltransferase